MQGDEALIEGIGVRGGVGLEGSALMRVLILVIRAGVWLSGGLCARIGVCATGGVHSLFIVCAVQAKIPLLDRYAKREEFHFDNIHPLQ